MSEMGASDVDVPATVDAVEFRRPELGSAVVVRGWTPALGQWMYLACIGDQARVMSTLSLVMLVYVR